MTETEEHQQFSEEIEDDEDESFGENDSKNKNKYLKFNDFELLP